MDEEFNPEAASEFEGGEKETPTPERPDIKMVIEAILADTTSLQMLAQALAPLLGLTGTEATGTEEETPEEPVE